MASFQAKTSWERLRKSKNKNYRSDRFLSDLLQRISKKQQKNLINWKTLLWLLFKPKQVGKCLERVKIKIIVPISSYPACNREFQKKQRKIQKIKKHNYGFFSRQNKLEKAEKE